jgi:hypothetical protein
VSRVHGPMDRYSSWSTVEHDHSRVAPTTGLDVIAPKWTGEWGEPHHDQEAVLSVTSEERWRWLKLDGEAIWSHMSGARAWNRGGD